MIGIIAQLNIQDNSAIVVSEDKKQYPFSLDACIGFNSDPEIGEKVEFGLNDNEVFFVEPYLKEPDENLETKEKLENTPNKKELSKKSTVQLNIRIALDKNVEDCLENYFEEVISKVYEYEAEFEEGENLDFLLMRRFLNTAYNNLKDMDSTFMDDYLLELRDDIKVLENVYQKFHKKNLTPLIAYESIFLNQQSTYKNYKARMETNTSELVTLNSAIKTLEQQIKDTQKEINLNLVAKIAKLKEIDLKRYKTYYVNSIHRAGNLKDENSQLKDSLIEFEEKYVDDFILLYNEQARDYDSFIREQLDGYAYEFDKKMWERAETSSSIRGFFNRANIEDDYSSKTFLKYFIKSLDNTKFSTEHKRLNELLEYLESRAKMRILILSEDTKESDHIRHMIRSFDKEYSVEKSDKPRSTYYRKDLARLDIIFADFNMKNPLIMEFIDMLQKRLQQSGSKANLCITSNSFTKENLIKLKQKNIHKLLATNLSDNELQLNLKDILDDINE